MLSPKRSKFRKQHRGRLKGKASSGDTLAFGNYGLQALDAVWLTARQIEATRRIISRYVKKGGKMWIRVFPDKPVTARAAESRMGSGKGVPEYWVAVIKPGHIIFEVSGINKKIAVEALMKASYKLPMKTRFIFKEDDYYDTIKDK
uniref:Large ribosomal subunit protein uL16c n=1 Tax=Boldia erythrosiphon TaxID=74908 RepID=A0A1Y9TLT7_9RHOD|nr:50S ribosomal protein L16 [Boldia erythrosiphon]ARO90588.1 50S ribosomal protein L16 [Boldia erythrosiphon]